MLESTLIIGLVLVFSAGLTNVFYKYIKKIVGYILVIIVLGAVIWASSTSLFDRDFIICAIIVFLITPILLINIDFFKKDK